MKEVPAQLIRAGNFPIDFWLRSRRCDSARLSVEVHSSAHWNGCASSHDASKVHTRMFVREALASTARTSKSAVAVLALLSEAPTVHMRMSSLGPALGPRLMLVRCIRLERDKLALTERNQYWTWLNCRTPRASLLRRLVPVPVRSL